MKEIQIKCQGAGTLPLESLTQFQGNLKTITPANLKKLRSRILDTGFVAPIFIWKHKKINYILDGHQRILALLSLQGKGYHIPDLPVAYIEADNEEDARKKLLSITTQYGEFDLDELHSWLSNLEEELKDSFRFVDDEINIAFDKEPDETEEDDAVDLQVEPVSKLGDVWEIGAHRLMCGDSTKSDDVAELMDGKLADMIFTDPPYGVSYKGTNNPNGRAWNIIDGDRLRGDDLYKLLYGAFLQLFAHSIENPAVYIWHASSTQMVFETAIQDAGFEVKEQLIWNKGMVLGHSDYHWTHEPLFYCRKKGQNNTWYGDRKQRTILRQEKIEFDKFKKTDLILILETLAAETTNWEIKKDGAQTYVHPTQKPVDLCMRAIRNNTTPQQNKVMDLFSGSASTVIACEKAHRIAFAMEIDPHYTDIGVQRYITWCEANGKIPEVKLNGKTWEVVKNGQT